MIDCIGVAGVDASISREVAHTCAAIGAQKSGVPLFLAEGGLELLNNLAKSKNIGVQIETAAALCEFARVADAHRALHKGGSLAALVGLARSRNAELQRHVAVAFAEMAERRIAKTWIVQVTRRRSHHYHRLTHQHHHHLHLTSPIPSIVQCGILPHLFSIIRVPGAHPEAVYMAAKALVYVR